jgi:Amidohydrolase family
MAGVLALQDVRSPAFALIHAAVVDGTTSTARPNQTVVISGDRILAVAPFGDVRVPETTRTIDATDQFIVPGLWDVHVHTRYEGIDHLRLLLANGITSARDMGGAWQHLREINDWREQIKKGQRVGPRLWAAGPLLDGPGSAWSHAAIINNPEEGRETVRRLKHEGADFVKVYDLLSRESFLAIAGQAKAEGLTFAGHVPSAVTASEASDAGQRSIEHLPTLLLAASDREEQFVSAGRRPPPAALADSISLAKVSALAERLKNNGTYITPTLSLFWNMGQVARNNPAVVNAERLRYIPGGYRNEWKRTAAAADAERQRAAFEKSLEVVRQLHRAGVTILAGTDVVKPYFVPGESLHDELALLVKAGLSETEALQAATGNPARFFNLTDQGTIATGARADLVLLDANPLENIENTRKIRAVVAGGHLFQRTELDAMLADVEKAAIQWTGTPTGR